MSSRVRRLIVIGGVAAGMSAASAARRHDPDLEILVYEQSPYVSYGSCGLPYYISDVIKDHKSLINKSKTRRGPGFAFRQSVAEDCTSTEDGRDLQEYPGERVGAVT
ncbi:MAG: hypothetical protein M1598_04280, partial [Actinobacteria bacterium]|nr:hypothetical protein [Actinomycetota bacterium]